MVPLGLGFGRIGNFINGELWGKPTDVAWAFNGQRPRCASLAALRVALEGFVLFAMSLVVFGQTAPLHGGFRGMFLLLYGVFRFFVEFYRVPDAHLGYLALGWVTMGQILSVPMIAVGAIMLFMAYRAGEANRTLNAAVPGHDAARARYGARARKTARGPGRLASSVTRCASILSPGISARHDQEAAFTLHHSRVAVVPVGRQQYPLPQGKRCLDLGRMGRREW